MTMAFTLILILLLILLLLLPHPNFGFGRQGIVKNGKQRKHRAAIVGAVDQQRQRQHQQQQQQQDQHQQIQQIQQQHHLEDRRQWFRNVINSCALPIVVVGFNFISTPNQAAYAQASATTSAATSSSSSSPLSSSSSFTTTTTTTTTTSTTTTSNNNLDDLPPEAVRSYLQYRFQLQTAADFYIFELQDKLNDFSKWGEIGELFVGTPTRMEREFVNTFRIIGLSMPPDESDTMRDAQYKFERAIGTLSKVTAGIRRDLPIDIDPKLIPLAIQGWDDGRIALNEFFTVLNDTTGLNELQLIPERGPQQITQYGRSEKRYVELKKKIRLCQNRGGPILSQAWGTLMVSGYLQDSCGIPDLESYFYQT